jgi:hypothetical protein
VRNAIRSHERRCLSDLRNGGRVRQKEVLTIAPEQKRAPRASADARRKVNGLFRGGDKRPRSERYNGGSKLGVKVIGGAGNSAEFCAGYDGIDWGQ